jgi:hypothetical protein
MNIKQRFVSGVIFIIGGIILFILIFFGMHQNPQMGISFSFIAFLFICIGVGQIVYSNILKNKASTSTKNKR